MAIIQAADCIPWTMFEWTEFQLDALGQEIQNSNIQDIIHGSHI